MTRAVSRLGVGERGEFVVEAFDVGGVGLLQHRIQDAFDVFLVVGFLLEKLGVFGFGVGVLAVEEKFAGADGGREIRLIDQLLPQPFGGLGLFEFVHAAGEREVADGIADVGGIFLAVRFLIEGAGW